MIATNETKKRPRLLTEVLRPRTIDQLILPPRIRKVLGNGELNQNFLLYGGPGLGKTSAAKVLAGVYKETTDPLYINCSDSSGVDTVRTQITNFCSTLSVIGGQEALKVVILDEVDGVSDQFFKALRGTIEKFAEQARFIATCNYFNKIPDAIQSRFSLVNFDFLNKEEEEYVRLEHQKRAKGVLTKLNIAHSDGTVGELVEACFPDMRKLFNKIQTMQISNVTELTSDIIANSWSFEELFELCASTPSPKKNYQELVGQYGSRADDVLGALGDEFPTWLMKKHPGKEAAIPQIIVKIAQYQQQRLQVIDPAISMIACVFELQMILSK